MTNPLDSTAAVVAEGKILYEMYCDHCHGPKGAVMEKYAEKKYLMVFQTISLMP